MQTALLFARTPALSFRCSHPTINSSNLVASVLQNKSASVLASSLLWIPVLETLLCRHEGECSAFPESAHFSPIAALSFRAYLPTFFFTSPRFLLR